MCDWAKKEGASFHLSGKKAPGLLLFKQKIGSEYTKTPENVDQLKLCDTVIELTKRQKILGMVISTCPKIDKKSFYKSELKQKAFAKQSESIIDKFGYFAEPDLNYLVHSGYRFQQLRGEIDPKRLWKAIMSYFVGKLRFAVAFHWLRCTKTQLNTMRFYYCMALSALVDKNAYETMGAASCASLSVSEENKSYLRLCTICKMPTLQQLAVMNAKSVTKQIYLIDQEWFSCPNGRAWVKEKLRISDLCKQDKDFYPSFVRENLRGTIIEDYWKLGKIDITDQDCDQT